jgi:hypothetical protein
MLEFNEKAKNSNPAITLLGTECVLFLEKYELSGSYLLDSSIPPVIIAWCKGSWGKAYTFLCQQGFQEVYDPELVGIAAFQKDNITAYIAHEYHAWLSLKTWKNLILLTNSKLPKSELDTISSKLFKIAVLHHDVNVVGDKVHVSSPLEIVEVEVGATEDIENEF